MTDRQWTSAVVAGLTAATLAGADAASDGKTPRVVGRMLNAASWVGGFALAIWGYGEFGQRVGRRLPATSEAPPAGLLPCLPESVECMATDRDWRRKPNESMPRAPEQAARPR